MKRTHDAMVPCPPVPVGLLDLPTDVIQYGLVHWLQTATDTCEAAWRDACALMCTCKGMARAVPSGIQRAVVGTSKMLAWVARHCLRLCELDVKCVRHEVERCLRPVRLNSLEVLTFHGLDSFALVAGLLGECMPRLRVLAHVQHNFVSVQHSRYEAIGSGLPPALEVLVLPSFGILTRHGLATQTGRLGNLRVLDATNARSVWLSHADLAAMPALQVLRLPPDTIIDEDAFVGTVRNLCELRQARASLTNTHLATLGPAMEHLDLADRTSVAHYRWGLAQLARNAPALHTLSVGLVQSRLDLQVLQQVSALRHLRVLNPLYIEWVLSDDACLFPMLETLNGKRVAVALKHHV
jgi:hypothetical protein